MGHAQIQRNGDIKRPKEKRYKLLFFKKNVFENFQHPQTQMCEPHILYNLVKANQRWINSGRKINECFRQWRKSKARRKKSRDILKHFTFNNIAGRFQEKCCKSFLEPQPPKYEKTDGKKLHFFPNNGWDVIFWIKTCWLMRWGGGGVARGGVASGGGVNSWGVLNL